MDIFLIVIIAAAVSVIGMNIAATRYIATAPAYSSEQKKIQITLIWLIPILGAVLFSWFLWQDRQKRSRKEQIGNNTAITNEDAIDYAISLNHHEGR